MNCKKCNYEDNQLRLVHIKKDTNIYEIDCHGNLKFYDNRDISEELYLECSHCNTKYKYENEDNLTLIEAPVLKKLMSYDAFKLFPVNKVDLKFNEE